MLATTLISVTALFRTSAWLSNFMLLGAFLSPQAVMGTRSFLQSALKSEDGWLHALSCRLRQCLFLFVDVCGVFFVTGFPLNYTDRDSLGFSLKA